MPSHSECHRELTAQRPHAGRVSPRQPRPVVTCLSVASSPVMTKGPHLVYTRAMSAPLLDALRDLDKVCQGTKDAGRLIRAPQIERLED